MHNVSRLVLTIRAYERAHGRVLTSEANGDDDNVYIKSEPIFSTLYAFYIFDKF